MNYRGFELANGGVTNRIGGGDNVEREDMVVGNSFSLRSFERMLGARDGWLYSQVATMTTTEPRTKVKVNLKSKRKTEARKERTMLRLVAKPLIMLSEYLMTIAVSRPPET